MGKALIFLGAGIMALGVAISLGANLSWLGRLPGDLHLRKEGYQIHVPVTTCILISLLLTFVFNLFRK